VTRKDEERPPYRHFLTSKYTFKDYVESGMPASSTEGSAHASAQCRHMCERVESLGFILLVPMSVASAMGVHGRPLRVLRTGFDDSLRIRLRAAQRSPGPWGFPCTSTTSMWSRCGSVSPSS
jgi:hypothetical protein